MHRTKATTAVGGRIDDRLCDRTVFFASKLRTCMEGLLELRTYRIGNLFLRQAKGIPIGGPISGAILDLVLARAECRFDIFVWPKNAEAWNLAGPGSKWVTFGRYVDDIISISRWLCPSCVATLLPIIYQGIVSFDPCDDGLRYYDPFIAVEILDLWFYVGWDKIETSLIHKNNLFAYTGDTQYLAKNRYPLPSGDFTADSNRLTSDFKGRLARFRQICSTRTQVFLYLFLEFSELLHLGFKMVVTQTGCMRACQGDNRATFLCQSIIDTIAGCRQPKTFITLAEVLSPPSSELSDFIMCVGRVRAAMGYGDGKNSYNNNQ